MTLVEALAALRKAEMIRNPWPPGSLWVRGQEFLRVVTSSASGPSVWESMDLDDQALWVRCTEEEDGWPFDSEPVITDHATEGCLLALLREARDDETIRPSLETPKGYLMWHLPGLPHGFDSEREAVMGGLIAMASWL